MITLTELNKYLPKFPNPSATVSSTKFLDHELTDIATNAISNLWIKAMTYHNFDPLINSPSEFTSFCECIEQVESMSGNMEKNSHTKLSTGTNGKVHSKSKTGKRKARFSPSTEGTGMWCELHQTDTHDTGNCKVLLAQAKKMRGAWEASGLAKGYSRGNSGSNISEKNGMWKKNKKIIMLLN